MTTHIESGEKLVKAGIITASMLEKALIRQQENGKGLGAVLGEMGAVNEDQWVAGLAKAFGFKTVNSITGYTFPPELLGLVPAEFAAQHLVFPLKQKDGMLATAVTDPFDSDTLDALARKTGLKIVPFLARRAEVMAAITAHYPPPKAPSKGNKRKILVVDDSQAIASIIRAALENEGYQVAVGHDGLEGLKLAMAERPDLIVTDTVMPRMDGFGLLRTLKGNPETANIPMILLTAKSGGEEEQRALEAGFLDFIPKPVQPIRVVSRVKRAFQLVHSMEKA